jgi:hypothetical protein
MGTVDGRIAMKKLLPLAALLAVPASAQDGQVYYASSTWPVNASGSTCTMVQAVPDEGNVLSISYDGSVVTLTTSSTVASALPASGKTRFDLVFLDSGNGAIDYDTGWGSREFTYVRDGNTFRFSNRFTGERNVAQILTDLASSRTIGFLQRGQAVVAYELTDAAPSVAQLRACAARSLASN